MSQDAITLQMEVRDTVGKGLNKLRRSGKVPAVIHDHGKPSIIVQGSYVDVYKTFLKAGKHHLVDIKAGDKNYTTLIKDADFEPKKGMLTHVVFNAVRANEKVSAEVPVQIKYPEGDDATPAERAGLIVLNNTETVEIEALPRDLPDVLYVPSEKLAKVGDQVTAGELELPAGVVLKSEEGTVLATVFEPSALAAANDAAGGDAESGDEAKVEAVHEGGSEEAAATTEEQ